MKDDILTMSRDDRTKLYYDLCDERDKRYKAAAPKEAELAKLNQEVIALQEKQKAVAAEIDTLLGGPDDFYALKKKIGSLATLLGPKIPPRPDA